MERDTYSANLFFLILILLQILAMFIVSPLVTYGYLPSYAAIVITEFLLILLPSIIYMIITGQPIVDTLKFKSIGVLNLLIVISMGILIYPIATFVGFVSQLVFHNYLADAFQGFTNMPLWADLLMLAVTPAICEEIAMRGVILSGYKNVNIRKAAIMNGFLFGILHMNPQQFFYAFIIGVVFVYIVDITQSIFSSMLCHFTCNGISFTLAYYSLKVTAEKPDMESLSMSVKLTSLVTLFALAVICTGILVLLFKALKAVNKDNQETRTTIENVYEQASAMQEDSKNSWKKIFNWPVYTVIAIYILFIIAFQVFSKVPMIGR